MEETEATKEEIIELYENLPAEESTQPEQKTKLDQFMDKLRVYQTEAEAKTHIQDIAKTLECAKSLGYKAIKKLKREGAFGNVPKREAHEPTAKINVVDESELETPTQ